MNLFQDPILVATSAYRHYYSRPGKDALEYKCWLLMSHLLKDYNIYYESFDFRNESFCGMLTIDEDETSIVYNAAHPIPRQHFTIAHELGHYFLHKEQKKNFADRAIDMLDSKENILEIQANAFAAEIIIPNDVLSLMLSYRYGFQKIAMSVGSSYSCLKWRLLTYLKEKAPNMSHEDILIVIEDYTKKSDRKDATSSLIFHILSKTGKWDYIYKEINGYKYLSNSSLIQDISN